VASIQQSGLHLATRARQEGLILILVFHVELTMRPKIVLYAPLANFHLLPHRLPAMNVHPDVTLPTMLRTRIFTPLQRHVSCAALGKWLPRQALLLASTVGQEDICKMMASPPPTMTLNLTVSFVELVGLPKQRPRHAQFARPDTGVL
jgi:hypothetical protein